MTDGSGVHHYAYSDRAEASSESQVLAGTTYTTSRTYRADGEAKTVTYPTGEALTYNYDAARRQTTMVSSLGGSYVTSTTYDALSQPLTQGLGNGVTSTYTYETLSKRLSSLTAAKAGTTVFQRSYTYDLGGNVQTLTANDSLLGSETLRYGYDHRDRLTSACAVSSSASTTCLGGSTFNESYAYDLIGNFTSKAATSYTYTAGKPHAVSNAGALGYTYDANGNMLTGAGRTYTWNVENQPTQIQNGLATETYGYDGQNSRITKSTTDASGTKSVTYVAGGLVEYWSDGKVISNYGVAVRTTTGNPSATNLGSLVYLHSDHLGSVGVTTDSSGALAEAERYDPWGKTRAGDITSTEKGYTGQRYDTGTGLLFYNARYYDASLARFVSADAIVPNTSHRALTVDFHELGFGSAVASENNQNFWFMMGNRERQNATPPWGPSNPQELNRFSYVNNNPLKYSDPSGHTYLTVEQAQQVRDLLVALVRDIGNELQNGGGLLDSIKKIAELFLATRGIPGGVVGRLIKYFVGLITGMSADDWQTQIGQLLVFAADMMDQLNHFIEWALASGNTNAVLYMEFQSEATCGNNGCRINEDSIRLKFYWNGKYQGSISTPLFIYDYLPISDCRGAGEASCSSGKSQPGKNPEPNTAMIFRP